MKGQRPTFSPLSLRPLTINLGLLNSLYLIGIPFCQITTTKLLK